MRPETITAQDIQRYHDKRSRRTERTHIKGGARLLGGQHAANRDVEVLKHVLRKAVRWGVLAENPAREVEMHDEPPRSRYVTDQEYAAVYALAPTMVQITMDLAVLTGQRRGDLLTLTRDQLTEDGILFTQAKTGKRLIVEWSDELRAVVARAKAEPPQVRRTLICTRQGQPYSSTGFSTIWSRVMSAALKGDLAERFQFRDLRAKSASEDSAEAATARLGHATAATTMRVYRRLPSRARPLR
jgi:integrase